MTPQGDRSVILTTRSARHCTKRLEELDGIQVSERFDLGGIKTVSEEELAAGLAGAWAVVAGGEEYTTDVFRALPDLRAILRWGVGYDGVDVDAATAADVAVTITPGAGADAVADQAVALMLACLRRLPELDRVVRDGSWKYPELTGDLTQATVGIVGIGHIGRAVAKRVKGFDCRVLAADPQADADYCRENGIEIVELDAMLEQADAISVHAPLSPATHHLIGAPELERMPSHAVIVNTARGQLIDEEALTQALEDGSIAGAGLDVFEREPLPPDAEILTLPNVVVTPHCGAFTHLATRRTDDFVVGQMSDLLAGRPPQGKLNPAVAQA